jgi:PAS domain S-box-containing protein
MSTNDPARRNRVLPFFTSYGLAVLLVATATNLRWGLEYAFGPMPTFLTFYPALMLAALIGGLGPGLAATGLGGLAADYFFIPPIDSLKIANLADGAALALFCFIGAFISVITNRLRTAVAVQAREKNEQRRAAALASIGDAVIATIGDAVIATDVAGRIIFMNPAAESLTGWTRCDALMKQVTEIYNIVNEQTRREAENPVTKISRQGIVVGLTNHTILVKKDGTEVLVDDGGAPIKDKDGNTTGAVLVFRDITERKRIEEKLQRSEERYRSLFTSMTEGFALHEIILGDQGAPIDYRFLEVNPAFERLTGLTRREIVGRLKTEALPDDDPEWISIYGSVALTGRPIHFERYSSALRRHYRVFSYCPAPRIGVPKRAFVGWSGA